MTREYVPFGSLTKEVQLGIVRSVEQQKKSGKIPYLKMNNITMSGKISLDDIVYVTASQTELKKYSLSKGDLIFNTRNSLELVGKTAVWNDELENTVFNNNIMRIRFKTGINPKFINYFMIGNFFRTALLKAKKATTNVCAVYKKDLFSQEIPFFDKKEQDRIVSKLDSLFSHLDVCYQKLDKIQTQLKQYRHSILGHAFEGKLSSNWRKKNKIQNNVLNILHKIKDEKNNFPKKFLALEPDDRSDLFIIPETWCWSTLGLFTESMKNGIYKPKSFYSDTGVACLRMYNIDDGKILWKDIKRMNLTGDEISEYGLEPGDLLVNRVNSSELVGKTAVIPADIEKCVYESKNIRVRLFGNYIHSKLISYWFQIFHRTYFNKHAQQTVGMASINQDQLSQMPIPFMSSNEQKEMIENIETLFSHIDKLENVITNNFKKFETLKISILKSAFESKLVTQNPNDEHASLLLEKIKKS